MNLLNNPTRRFDFVQKLERFLIAAVGMILVIRTELWLTHYPQLGGGGLHIAHLLYGGIFMVVAIWFSLIYLNRWARTVTAVIGGIGFGFFIDELGKFITEDNNYFFKPAAGIIYVIFIAMFLIIRELSRRQTLEPNVALANALSILPLTANGEFRREDAARAKRLLDMADQGDPMVGKARELFREATVLPSKPPSRFALMAVRIREWITVITTRPWFEKAVVTVLILWAVIGLLTGLVIVFELAGFEAANQPPVEQGVIGSGETVSILVSSVLVFIGAWKMIRGNHLAAYRYFIGALLVSILVTRVFVFIESQFAAVIGLLLDLILYAAVSELASEDRQEEHRFGGLGMADVADPEAPEKP